MHQAAGERQASFSNRAFGVLARAPSCAPALGKAVSGFSHFVPVFLVSPHSICNLAGLRTPANLIRTPGLCACGLEADPSELLCLAPSSPQEGPTRGGVPCTVFLSPGGLCLCEAARETVVQAEPSPGT